MANDTPMSAPEPTQAEPTTTTPEFVDLPARDAEGAVTEDVRGGGGGFLVAQAPTSNEEAERIMVNLQKAADARAAMSSATNLSG
jgi:hypothetical protein